jgi:putative zinc finger/helix-turn-helix YgiT family protein
MRMKTKKTKQTLGARPHAGVLPDSSCPTCGAIMRDARGKLRCPVNGEDVTVPNASFLKCPQCGEIVLRYDEARGLSERALEIYRKKYGLLSAAEIRSIRERFGLTQAGLAKLLRLGNNTISRWEAKRNVQTAAMDVLLRILRDLPGSLDYLRRRVA